MQRSYAYAIVFILTMVLGTSTITSAADVDQLLGRVAGVAPAQPQQEAEQSTATTPADSGVLMAYG